MAFVSSQVESDLNALWKIEFSGELAISPTTDHREVCCAGNKIKLSWDHDIQFTIGNDNFQEVVCHNNERLGGNDEWCIELIKKIK
ncbi:unnamed protein product [Rhizophagus irregularis]|nr:unnamed protein product [Rhizophagus irregularis]